MSHKPIRKAVFPVAGLGTRFLPATKVMPKEMLPIGDRPLIQHVVEEAQQAGIEEFIFITGRHKNMLEEHFDYQPELMQTLKLRGKDEMLDKVRNSQMREGKLFLTRQAKPLGLGHAIWCARKLVGDEPFAILLPDVLMKGETGCLSQMVNVYNQYGGNVIALEQVPEQDVNKYGIVTPGEEKEEAIEVKDLVEKPDIDKAPSTLSIVGRYILQPEIFELLSSFDLGTGNEIQLTDAMAKLVEKQAFHGMEFKGKSFDCGSRLGFLAANIAYGLDDADIGDDVKELIQKHRD
ncbi:MAG: UTP--glucose-1-phosphate uridylyltransferase GalU [Pseudomonadota bacterium]